MDAEPETLRSFIGPPLYDSFRGTMGMSDADAKRAVDTYRVYFRDKGIFENAPYPGVPEMLEALRAAGGRLIVATSKPEVFAKRIAEHFGFARSLDGVYGADMEGKRSSKIDVIRYAIREQGITPSGAVMVGDRKYDIVGAHEAGLADIGVLYGYGRNSWRPAPRGWRQALRNCVKCWVLRAFEGLRPFCVSLWEGGKIRFHSNRFHLPHKKVIGVP